jgi:hypothetical protein
VVKSAKYGMAVTHDTGSPGARPIVGHKLLPEDQIVLVDDVKVNNDNIVELVRGSNVVGTKVHLTIKRAATGAMDYVVCVRALLNHVENSRDLEQLIAEAKKNPHVALISKIDDKIREIQEDHSKTVNLLRTTIGSLEKELDNALGSRSGPRILQTPGPLETPEAASALKQRLSETESNLAAARKDCKELEASIVSERARCTNLEKELGDLQEDMKSLKAELGRKDSNSIIAAAHADAQAARAKIAELQRVQMQSEEAHAAKLAQVELERAEAEAAHLERMRIKRYGRSFIASTNALFLCDL